MKLENRFTVPVPRDQALQVLLDVERIAPCMPGAALTSRDGDHFTGTVKVKVGPINLTYGGKAHFVSVDEAAGVVIIEGSGKETRGTGTAKALVTCRLIDKGATTDVEVDTDLNVTGKPASFGRGVLGDVSGKLVDQFAACLAEEILAGTPTTAAGAGAGAGAPTGAAEATAAGAGAGAAGAAVGAAGASGANGSAASGAPGVGGDPSALGQLTAGDGPGAPLAAVPAPPPPARQRPPQAEVIDLLGTAGAPVLKRLAPVAAGVAVLLLVIRRLLR